MLRALGDYGRLMVFPGNLHMERTVFQCLRIASDKGRADAIQFEYLSLLGLALLATLIFLCTRRGEGQRMRIFGAAWFIMAYLPTSNVVELNATVAEHWLYLPSIGFIIFLAGCFMDLPARWRHAAASLACVAAIALGLRSAVRSCDWESNEVFARRTIAAAGPTIRVALLLGQVYLNRADYVQAERAPFPQSLAALSRVSDRSQQSCHRTRPLGKEKEAEALFASATKAAHEMKKDYPRTWIAALNLAHMREDQKNRPEAVSVLEKARHDYPNTWELVRAETELLREDGHKIDEAMDLIRPYAEKNWWHHDAWMALGRLYAQEGKMNEASEVLRHASWLDMHETDALNLLALVRMRQQRLGDAVKTQQRAVARQPDQPQQYLLLSELLRQSRARRRIPSRPGRGDATPRFDRCEVARLPSPRRCR